MSKTVAHLSAMVIDDQEMMRSIVRTALKRLGLVRVMEANSGNTALALLRESKAPPDIIFCDIHMENGGGTEFINMLRRDEALKKLAIPVVVLTGEEDDMLLDICRQVGAVTILHKPCSITQIAAALSKVFGFTISVTN